VSGGAPMLPVERSIEAGGLRWHLMECGEGPGVLLVHGAGSSAHSWREVMPLLAGRHRVVAVDLPGHGSSSLPVDGRIPIERIATALAQLLSVLEFVPRILVGHSAGAAIVCRLALDANVKPDCVVAINGALLPPAGLSGLWFAPAARLLALHATWMPGMIARFAGNAQSVRRLVASTGSTLDAAGIEAYVRLVSDPKHLAGSLALLSQWDLAGLTRDLPQLTMPLVLIVAENDRAVPPEQARQIARRVPVARLVYIPHLGHLAHEEAPRMLAEQILEAGRLHGREAGA
jgi:magnesium chelatase accessory protein